ncbi:hypothetical protein EZ456_04065 [Pedobacter psychrodurus]|uniref:Outer membrane protein beta-barrel domain-containing protein n=1 Tax=Pedobacter psychrodurus TaxID=2530456 RepID=A0A4R0Q2J9_9SPHI|nr:hypothetical protein [Pedobacter psychrodurus]TCD28573.1 hypothetical protein EZ456_04065 [Pedobacter psychrodurus]
MKTIFTIILCALAINISAQTKKTPVKKPAAKTVTKPAAKTTAVAKASTKPISYSTSNNYKTAVGVKFLYGISLTAKHFLKEKHALEGIFTYRGFNGLGTQIGVSVAYEYHQPINGAPNLKWYVGGGGHFEYFSFDDDLVDPATTIGALGVLGLEYKLKSIPIAISADWQPVFTFNSGGGFSAENGGIGVKYTF